MNIIRNKKGTVLVIRPTLKSIKSKLKRSFKVSRKLRGRLHCMMSNDSTAQTEINKGLTQQRGYRGAILRYIKAITVPRPNKHRPDTSLVGSL